MHLLCSYTVGGILLLIQHWDKEKALFGTPVLQVLANPVVASLGKFSPSDPSGVNLVGVWDLSTPPFDTMPAADTTCPIMASSGGFSRAVKPATMDNYLKFTALLFIPSGEKVASTVTIIPNQPFVRAMFLPPVCACSIGMSGIPRI
jgi:hypothetical protein